MSIGFQQPAELDHWRPDAFCMARPNHRRRMYPFDENEFRYREPVVDKMFPLLGDERLGWYANSLKVFKQFHRRKQRCYNNWLIRKEMAEFYDEYGSTSWASKIATSAPI